MSKQDKPNFAAPLTHTVPLRSSDIVVTSANMAALLAVKALLVPVLEQLAEEAPRIFDQTRIDLILATGDITANDIADLCVLLDQADVVVDFIAALTPLTKAEVLALMPDEFGYLFAVAVQVNADFFVLALPVLKGVVQRVRASGVLPAQEPAPGPAAQPNGTSSSPAPSTA